MRAEMLKLAALLKVAIVSGMISLLLGGCGGNGTQSSSPTPVPSAAQKNTPAVQPPETNPAPTAPDSGSSTTTSPRESAVHPTPAAADSSVKNPPTELEPVKDASTSVPNSDTIATFGGFTGPKPATWISQPTQRVSAIAEYGIPGRDGFDQGRLTVFRVGGSPEQNITRWQNQQFRGPNQTQVQPKIENHTVDGMDVMFVEFNGEYKGQGAVNFSPNHTLLAAIYPDAPGGQIILYMVGPTGTIEPNRKAFMDLMMGLRQVEPTK